MSVWHVPAWRIDTNEEIVVQLSEGDPIPPDVQLVAPFATVCVVDGRWAPPAKPPRLTGPDRAASPWIVGERTETMRDGRRIVTEERLHTPGGQIITASWSEELDDEKASQA